jgi:hypothetical protein
MPYHRPQSSVRLTKPEKLGLLVDYFEHYRELAATDPALLNVKASREASARLLDQIGDLLLAWCAEAVTASGPVREFLDANPLPAVMKGLLPDEFRAFCLALNSLKQWVAAEQAATDRYLLGGAARQLCRQAVASCVLTGEPLDCRTVELHHPVRDGRPPIAVTRASHARIEGQGSGEGADPQIAPLRALLRKMGRSWKSLRLGCRALLGHPVHVGSRSVLASSKTLARKATELTGWSYEQILEWLDTNGF